MAESKSSSSRKRSASSTKSRPLDVLGKAKVPLIAGGAAIAGAAGGAAIGARQARRHAAPRALRQMGDFGLQVGQLASELQRAREGANGEKHRSPIEVVLEGLTARRARA